MTPAPICNHGLCPHGLRIVPGITCHLCRFEEHLAMVDAPDAVVPVAVRIWPPRWAEGCTFSSEDLIDEALGEKIHDDEGPAAGRADRAGDDAHIVGADHRRDADRVALIGQRLDTARARLEWARARTGSSIDVIVDHMARLREFRAAREEYRAAVAKLLGATPDIIARRLSL